MFSPGILIEMFIFLQVNSQGQIIGAVVAENQIIAQRAAKLVKIVYDDLSPIIVTIPVRNFFKIFLILYLFILYNYNNCGGYEVVNLCKYIKVLKVIELHYYI